MTLAIILVYLLIVLSIGLISHRLFKGTGEDYFVATRSIGPFILLMSLFGTHMTAFALLGASGEAYHNGIGVFGLMASSSALIGPALFFFVGTKAWAIGKQFGYLTQIQYFRDRWQSDALGLFIFVILVAFMIPYLLIGIMAGGITLHQITDGQVASWIGSLLVCVVVLCYVTFGGLRGTAWANTFQTLVFMALGALAFVVIVNDLGGLKNALQRVAQEHPDLLLRGDKISPAKFFSYTLIPLSVGMFPHIFMHWLSARSTESFRYSIVFYPICIVAVWIPSVLLGIFGSFDFPDLAGPAANSVLIKMIAAHAPPVLAGFLAAGVFAAIMSSLDSQVLAIGTMFTHDIAGRYFVRNMDEKRQVLFGRMFVIMILALAFFIAQVADRSIFKLAIWSFTGFAALLPIVLAAMFWPRSTKAGAFSAIITVAISWVFFFYQSQSTPGYTVGGSGLMPVAVILPLSCIAMIVGSLLSPKPNRETVARFFPE